MGIARTTLDPSSILGIILTISKGQILSSSNNPRIKPHLGKFQQSTIKTTCDQVVIFWIWTETCRDKRFMLTNMMVQASYFWIQPPNDKKVSLYMTLQRKSFILQWPTSPIRCQMIPVSRQKRSVLTQALHWRQTSGSLKNSSSLRIS